MPVVNGLTLLGSLAFIVAACLAFCLPKNLQKQIRRDQSPLQKAKRDWRLSLAGSAKEAAAAERWDTLAVEIIKSAKTFQELDEAYEKALVYPAFWFDVPWFSLWEVLRTRESSVICEAFKAKHDQLHNEIGGGKIARVAAAPARTKCTAPRPEKLPTATGKNRTYCSR